MSALGSICRLCRHRSTAAGEQIRPACYEHTRGHASTHRCQTEPAGLCHVSVECEARPNQTKTHSLSLHVHVLV